jgi:hypothetical protein
VALLAQAGDALGMALVAIECRPDLHDIIPPVVIASTVLFEAVGPIFTREEFLKSGEARRT